MDNRTVHHAAGDAFAEAAGSSGAHCCPALACRKMRVAAGNCTHTRWAHLGAGRASQEVNRSSWATVGSCPHGLWGTTAKGHTCFHQLYAS
eukprot:12720731-Alexandrium_andersonii.AAC.1